VVPRLLSLEAVRNEARRGLLNYGVCIMTDFKSSKGLVEAVKFLRSFHGAHDDWAAEIELLQAVVKGLPKGRKCMASATSDPPQDCDAPFCGCDPAWSACIEMLQECNLLVDRRSAETTPRSTDERTLRRLLAFAYSGSNLYGDDGELQDGRFPMIDYLRDSVADIERKIHERGMKLLADAACPECRYVVEHAPNCSKRQVKASQPLDVNACSITNMWQCGSCRALNPILDTRCQKCGAVNGT
jgi:hypothetical protein